jgi:YD repeat-containing protein
MNRSYLFLIGLSILFIFSCRKNHSGNETLPKPTIEFSKLKKITKTSQYRYLKDILVSYEITTDSINNKIIVKTIQGKDTVTGTYNYNSNNQLELYEATAPKRTFYLTRMNFMRNGSGQLIKVLSEYYNNGITEKSEGICQYTKVQDTSFVTFIDTANKQAPGVKEMYSIGLVNNRIVSSIAGSNRTDFTYDSSGNLISYAQTQGASPAVVSIQIRSSRSPKEIKKFFDCLGSDIPWFSRYSDYGFIDVQNTLPSYYLMGNALEDMQRESTPWKYYNEFDSVGNLKKITEVKNPGYTMTAILYDFEYRP